VLVPWILGSIHPEFYQVAIRAASFEQVSEHVLFLLLGAVLGAIGGLIGRKRAQLPLHV